MVAALFEVATTKAFFSNELCLTVAAIIIQPSLNQNLNSGLNMVTTSQILAWLKSSGKNYAEQKKYLTELDTAIGDADHGNNMNRGFSKVTEQLDSLADKDIGTILKTVAMTLISSIGGASGPLYGTFFLNASKTAEGKKELSADDMQELLKEGVAGVKMRGKAEPGDKTMIDAFDPALEAYATSAENGEDIQKCLEAAASAAEKGAEETIPLIAKKGRASYLGERSKGHKDPGATSAAMLIRALSDAAEGQE